MSFERTNARDAAQRSTAGAAHATPGKRTQVQLLSTSHHEAPHHEAAKPEAHAASAEPDGVNLTTLQHFIAKHEGHVDHVYLDSRGFPTAGIGHLLPAGRYRVGQKISAAQITAWFRQDTAHAIAGARRDIGPAYDRLDEARKMVVIDMVFNLGSHGFGQFHATIHAIQTGNYAQAASNMLQSLWARQVGHRATEDAAIMRSGHLAGGGGTGGGEHGGGGAGQGGAGHGGAPTLAEVRHGHGVLKIGEHGPAVAKIQHMLHVAADGIFGHHTEHAVEKFQRVHHLAVDGIVGHDTLKALEHHTPTPHARHGHTGTGGAGAPGSTHDAHDGGHGAHHGKWSPAPSLAEVRSGAATLHEGEEGAAVKHVQHLLAVDADGKFGPQTRAAVRGFEHDHHMQRHDGQIDAHTLALLTKHPIGSVEGESHSGSAQRERLLGISRAGSAGRHPDGRCYFHVCQFLVQCNGYGKIKNPYHQFPASALPEAHDFADFINGQGPARWGLERLSIGNPYDAPAGAIVVVKAGSPGTANPTAGDIAVADGHGNFYNGGMMGYSGRAGWNASPHARLLGAYIPR
ncbi:MAG TPA: peptidoglycan-binding protein [Kofleriaceae bacterium]